MPKTSDEIHTEYADTFVSQRNYFEGDKDEDYIKDSAKFDKFANQIWFSEQELKHKLKEAEKRIDEIKMIDLDLKTHLTENVMADLRHFENPILNKERLYSSIENNFRNLEFWVKDKSKQILNDCFGVGK